MKTIVSFVLLFALVLMIGSPARAGTLVSYYDFNSSTLVDTASLYVENGGTTSQTLTFQDPNALGTQWVTGHTGGADVALHIQGGHRAAASQELDYTVDADSNLGANFTIEFWYNANGGFGNNTSQSFLGSTDFQANKAYGEGNPMQVAAGNGATVGPLPETAGWHFVALIAKSDGTFRVKVDGNWYSGTYTNNPLGTNSIISWGTTTGQNSSQLYLDDWAMWNTALAESTVNTHYTSGNYGLTLAPEPVTLSLLAIGGAAALLRRRRS